MGEVWRAHDTKLGRDVALKVLRSAVAEDAGRLTRLAREARTLASLNHPNIAQVHGLEESDGVRALIMELVEGPTLAERIARGPIPIREALQIATQIAEARSPRLCLRSRRTSLVSQVGGGRRRYLGDGGRAGRRE